MSEKIKKKFSISVMHLWINDKRGMNEWMSECFECDVQWSMDDRQQVEVFSRDNLRKEPCHELFQKVIFLNI